MAMRVTGRGKTGRHRLSPRSHILTKAVGDTITASWGVTNPGGVSAFAALDIFFPSLGTGFFGVLTSIPAGATVTLSVSGTITALTPGTTYNAEVRVTPAASATVAPGAVHPFTLTISGSSSLFDSYLAQIKSASTLADLTAVITVAQKDLEAGRLGYTDYQTIYFAFAERYGVLVSAAPITSVDTYLAQIAAATTAEELYIVQNSIQVDYAYGRMSLVDYQTLIDAYVARYNQLSGTI